MLREAILERQGIQLMNLSTIQLYNKDAFSVFAHNLAKRIKKRMQIRSKRFELMHLNLRRLLP
jgi:hypothetical protein